MSAHSLALILAARVSGGGYGRHRSEPVPHTFLGRSASRGAAVTHPRQRSLRPRADPRGEVVAIVGGDVLTDGAFRAFARSHARYNAIQIGEDTHLVEPVEVTAREQGS